MGGNGTVPTVGPQVENAFRHEALLYSGTPEFVEHVGAFIREGIDAGEPILVVVCEEKIDPLRSVLPEDTDGVVFADMRAIGRNPALIIPAWQDFLDTHWGPGRGVRGVGEPIWSERGPDELVECHRHEALLNLAFAGGTTPWWLVCPYDRDTLSPEVLAEARKTHPLIWEDGVHRESGSFVGPDAAAQPFDAPLPPPRAHPNVLYFGQGELGRVRRFVSRHADAFGFDASRRCDLLLAAHEVAANSIRHGGGEGTVRAWEEEDVFFVEVSDAGRMNEPLAGRKRPTPDQERRFGLWIANNLCDLVQIRTFTTGTVVRLHMSR